MCSTSCVRERGPLCGESGRSVRLEEAKLSEPACELSRISSMLFYCTVRPSSRLSFCMSLACIGLFCTMQWLCGNTVPRTIYSQGDQIR